MTGQCGRLASESNKDHLGDLLSAVVIAVQLPKRRSIDEIDMPTYQFGKGVLGLFEGITMEKGGVFHVKLHPIIAGRIPITQLPHRLSPAGPHSSAAGSRPDAGAAISALSQERPRRYLIVKRCD